MSQEDISKLRQELIDGNYTWLRYIHDKYKKYCIAVIMSKQVCSLEEGNQAFRNALFILHDDLLSGEFKDVDTIKTYLVKMCVQVVEDKNFQTGKITKTDKSLKLNDFLISLSQSTNESLSNEYRDPNRHWKNLLAYFSVIVCILLVLFVINLFKDKTSTSHHYTEYYKPLKVENINFDATDQAQTDPYFQGLTFYSLGKYDKAYQNFIEIDHPTDIQQFYQAICLLENKNYGGAQKILEQLSETSHSLKIQNETTWYLSLIHLKLNEVNHAKKLLHKISQDENHSYKLKSRELLNKID